MGKTALTLGKEKLGQSLLPPGNDKANLGL